MATGNIEIKLKVVDLDEFGRLVNAIAAWAKEVSRRENLTAAERELFDAAVDLAETEKA